MSKKPLFHQNAHLIIDGSGLLFRAFHALPTLTTPEGTPVGAVVGFINMLWSLLRQHGIPKKWCMVFDAGRCAFRQQLYPDYKSNRSQPPAELITQHHIVKKFCEAFSLPTIIMPHTEADDVIASLATQAWQKSENYVLENPQTQQLKEPIVIVTGDKDMGQLITHHNILLYDPFKKMHYDTEAIRTRWDVDPHLIPHVQALMGDASDHIPGIPGIGPKTATLLVQRYGTLDNIIDISKNESMPGISPRHQKLLVTYENQARISYLLALLRCDVSLPKTVCVSLKEDVSPECSIICDTAYSFRMPDRTQLEEFFHTYSLPQVQHRLMAWIDEHTSFSHAPQYTTLIEEKPFVEHVLRQGVMVCVLDHNTVVAYDGDKTYAVLSFEAMGNVVRSGACATIVDDAKEWMHRLALSPEEASGGLWHDVGLMHYLLEGKNNAITPQIDVYGQVHALYTTYQKSMCRLIEEGLWPIYQCYDRPLLTILYAMEKHGVLVDKSILEQYAAEWAKKIAAQEAVILSALGVTDPTFNLSSPQQLGKHLFEILQWPAPQKNTYSVSASVLENLYVQGYAIAEDIIQWRQLCKLHSTYTTPLLEALDPNTGRLHTTYYMTATITGRLASRRPNVQQIPFRTEEGRNIRRAFIAPKKSVLLSCDYAHMELRLLAHMGPVPELQEAFWEGKDVHKHMAAYLFQTPYEKVDTDQRRMAKTLNFGMLYGLSSFGLAQSLHISLRDAGKIIEEYHALYPGIAEYTARTQRTAEEKGYVTTLYGRRCMINDIHSTDHHKRQAALRQAINAPLQGTSADVLKKAMILVDAYIKTQENVHMIMSIHDALLVEVPETEIDHHQENIIACMHNAASLCVPLMVHTMTGYTWAEECVHNTGSTRLSIKRA